MKQSFRRWLKIALAVSPLFAVAGCVAYPAAPPAYASNGYYAYDTPAYYGGPYYYAGPSVYVGGYYGGHYWHGHRDHWR